MSPGTDGNYPVYAFADVDGDGRSDLIYAGTDHVLYVRLSISTASYTGFGPAIATITNDNLWLDGTSFGSRHLDFTGSGQEDLVGTNSSFVTSLLHSTAPPLSKTQSATASSTSPISTMMAAQTADSKRHPFRIGGPWDAQRANGQWYPEFRSFASVAIGLYAGSAGMSAGLINFAANRYARDNSQFTGQVMDTEFPYLPQVNVDNTSLGVTLATVGGGFGVCTPGQSQGAKK